METSNSKPEEAKPVPAPIPAPAASAPEAAATPAVTAAPAPADKVEPVKGELPKTNGKTPGGWNRFAGYNPHEAKNKKNDRRDGQRGRR